MKEGGRPRETRGIGGPLLCIGDLLGDIAGDGTSDSVRQLSHPSSPLTVASVDSLSPYDLLQLFQENYDLLINSLSGTDHSWISSTLKLCAAIERTDNAVQWANSNASELLEKIELLRSVLKRGDAAVIKAAEILQRGLNGL